jgi:hypothetical protein
MMETVSDKTAVIIYHDVAGSVLLFPAIREKACECAVLQHATSYNVIHITVFC